MAGRLDPQLYGRPIDPPRAAQDAAKRLFSGPLPATGVDAGGYDVVIGSSCRIGSQAGLENCVLWDDVAIGEGARLKGCIIGNGATVKEAVPDRTRVWAGSTWKPHKQ